LDLSLARHAIRSRSHSAPRLPQKTYPLTGATGHFGEVVAEKFEIDINFAHRV